MRRASRAADSQPTLPDRTPSTDSFARRRRRQRGDKPVWYLRFEVVNLKASMLVMVGYTITGLYLLFGG
jgi:hypothetical protein